MGTRECNCVAHVGDYQKCQGGSDVQNRLKAWFLIERSNLNVTS